MKQNFETVIKHLIGITPEDDPVGQINIPKQFDLKEDDHLSTGRKLNAAFLILLSGENHPDYLNATNFINQLAHHPLWKGVVSFYKDGLGLIQAEISDKTPPDETIQDALHQLAACVSDPNHRNEKERDKTIGKFWELFFPEGISGHRDRDHAIMRLREKRKVRVTRLNPEPITQPAEEVLFSSNILLTTPSSSTGLDDLSVSSLVRKVLQEVFQEEQRYWYDHPIQIGVEPEHNEAIYGLKGLSGALESERKRGTVGPDARVTCFLSASVTHEGLQLVAREYMEDSLRKTPGIENLDLYLFTEIDCVRLLDEILLPAIRKYSPTVTPDILYEVVGVDGEYGRHYTFLKAISAFWQVLINPRVKATFKIDLDQVFPQKELVEQSGASAFEHLQTPLWGAEGIDHLGQKVELGMLAGALVNQKDIHLSLFTPDVSFPEHRPRGDEMVFSSKIPQALSTEAEMMTRYDGKELNGRESCIQRVHVTGGTNGILISALRKHRPFTPSFIGRAEDQAYLLSVLFQDQEAFLRYIHKDGLIMRHDKEGLAGEAIQAATLGKLIGDYVRILSFSFYARALPWPLEDIKQAVDPFTGCFISRIPVTVVYLRTALKVASFFAEHTKESDLKGYEFLMAAVHRLHKMVLELSGEPNPLAGQYQREKEAWHLFYDTLDYIERDLGSGQEFTRQLQKKAKAIMDDCRLSI